MPNHPNKTKWTPEMISYLKVNINNLTNKQLAEKLGLTLTVTRMKIYELGLQRMKIIKWTRKEIRFLKQNYKAYGDTEIAEMLNEMGNKSLFDRKRIRKKRDLLNLKRTREEIKSIWERHIRNKRYNLKNARKAKRQQYKEYIRLSKYKLSGYQKQLRGLEIELADLQSDCAPMKYTRWEIQYKPAILRKEIEILNRKIFLLPDSIKKDRIHSQK